MFNGNLGFLRNNETVALAEPLFPPVLSKDSSFSAPTTTTESDAGSYDDINMQDFVDISESSDTDPGEDDDSDAQRPSSAPIGSPSDATDGMVFSPYTPAANAIHSRMGLATHFALNSNLVGSFRRNQQHALHVSSLASHPEQRASTHEFNALQKGRRGAANTPMTPARKKRASQDLSLMPLSAGVRKSGAMSSPLAARRPRSRGNSIAHKNLQEGLAKKGW